jgi:hypothetical protein
VIVVDTKDSILILNSWADILYRERPVMTKVLDTGSWEFYALILILVIAAAILFIVIGYPQLQHHATPVPGGNQPVPYPTATGTKVTARNTPGVPDTVPTPSGTVQGTTTLVPASPSQPLPTASPIPTTAIVPVPFSLSVTPQSASARPGDTLTYTLDIQHGEGLTGPVHFSLAAHVLFFSQTYDLGAIDPPFPKSIKYDFTVPGNLPSGVTVNGVVTATGNGQTESEDISLNVL